MIEGRTGRSAHPPSRSNKSSHPPNCGVGAKCPSFPDSTGDLGFTEPADTTSLLRETHWFTR